MTDKELFDALAIVRRDAIELTEFTRSPKELSYAQLVTDKLEALRAKINGGPLVKATLRLVDDKIEADLFTEGLCRKR